MNKIFTQLIMLLCLVGVGVESVCANDTPYKSISFSGWAESIHTYSDAEWTDLGCTFSYASNNQKKWSYVRMGGKNNTATSSIKYNSALSENITKVTVNHQGKSNKNFIINGVTLSVYSDSNFSNQVDEVVVSSPEVGVNTPGTIDFTPSSGTSWPADSYYKVSVNWTVEGKTNYGLNVSSLDFHTGVPVVEEPKQNPTLTLENAATVRVGDSYTLDATPVPTSLVITYTLQDGADYASLTGNTVTGKAAGMATIHAATNRTDTYESANANIQIAVLEQSSNTTLKELTLEAKSNNIYYATFSNDKVTFFPRIEEGMIQPTTLKKVTSESDGRLQVDELALETLSDGGTEMNGYFVPANTGVLIQASFDAGNDPAKIPFYTVENKLVDAFAENLMHPASEEMTGDYKFYKLAYDDAASQTGLGFYWGADDGAAFTIKPGTAYLRLPKDSGIRSFVLDDIVDAIRATEVGERADNAIYNLQGQRVKSMRKGIYIINGKKVVLK